MVHVEFPAWAIALIVAVLVCACLSLNAAGVFWLRGGRDGKRGAQPAAGAARQRGSGAFGDAGGRRSRAASHGRASGTVLARRTPTGSQFASKRASAVYGGVGGGGSGGMNPIQQRQQYGGMGLRPTHYSALPMSYE